jgi:hypothetical protein
MRPRGHHGRCEPQPHAGEITTPSAHEVREAHRVRSLMRRYPPLDLDVLRYRVDHQRRERA